MRDLLNLCGVLLAIALTFAVAALAGLIASWCVVRLMWVWRRRRF